MRAQTYILLIVVILICKSISAQKIPEWFFTQEPNCAAGISLPIQDTLFAKKSAILCAQITNAIIEGKASFRGYSTKENDMAVDTNLIQLKLANVRNIEYINYIGDSICLLYARFDTIYTDTVYFQIVKQEYYIDAYSYFVTGKNWIQNAWTNLVYSDVCGNISIVFGMVAFEQGVSPPKSIDFYIDKNFNELFTDEYLNVNNGAYEILRKLLFLDPMNYLSFKEGTNFGHSSFNPEITKLEHQTSLSLYGISIFDDYKLSVRYIPHGTSQFEILIK